MTYSLFSFIFVVVAQLPLSFVSTLLTTIALKRYIVILLSFLSLLVRAQVEHISVEDGLSNRDITCVLQTRNGFMWFGTLNGLNRYDGYSIKEYNYDPGNSNSLSNGKIHSLCEDTNGALWIATAEGVNILDQRTGEIKLLKNTSAAGDQSPYRTSFLCETEGGSVLVGFSNGQIRRYQNAKEWKVVFLDKEKHFYSNGITSLYSIGADTLIAVINHSDIYRIIEGKSERIRIPGRDSDRIIKAMPFGISGNEILVADDYDGLSIIDVKTGALIRNSFIDSINMKYKGLTAFEWVNGSEAWAGYNNDEILKIDFHRHSVSQMGHYIKPFIHGAPRKFYKDSSGILWIGTNYGIIKFPPPSDLFEHYLTVPHGSVISANKSIRGMVEDEHGHVYLGGYSGLFKLDPQTGTVTHFNQIDNHGKLQTSYSVFRLLNDTAGYIWIGSEGIGFYRFDKALERFDYPANSGENRANLHYTFSMLDNGDGTFLLGTKSGLRIYDRNKNVLKVYETPPGPFDISSLEIMELVRAADGSVWIGTYNSGLYKLIPGKGVVAHYSTAAKNLTHNSVTALYLDEGNSLWVGTRGGGVDVINSDGRFTGNYNRQKGLSDNVIASICGDDEKNIWVSTFNGLSVLNKESGRFTNYFEKDGISDNEFNIASCLKTKCGKIYMGGLNGVNAFYPHELTGRKKKKPQLYLSGFVQHVGAKDTVLERSGDLSGLKGIFLSHNDKFVSFDFALDDYLNPQSNIFLYLLEGYDKNWNSLGTQNKIRFSTLPHGDYTLLVRGFSSQGVESENEYRLKIHVAQVFYESWWFLILVLLGVGLILHWIVRYRMRQQMKIQLLRTKISSDLHDEVGSLLTRISVQSELITQGIYSETESKEELQRIANISRQATAAMSDVLWSIDARNDKMGNLIDHLREHAEETLAQMDIAVDFTVNLIDSEKEIDPFVRQNIFLIYKEALNNIVKHSGAGNVVIKLENSGREFSMLIGDDGKGFSDIKQVKGQGLKNLRMRAESINALLEIRGDSGCCIKLTCVGFI